MLDFLTSYPELTNQVGIIGFFAYIVSFSLVQTGRMCGNGLAYASANIIAATLVLISLVNAFNMASFLIQISFISIGIVGVARQLLKRRRPLGRPIKLLTVV